MLTRPSLVLLCVFVCAAPLWLGCSGSGLHAVSGEVSLDGEPVDGGNILFLPTEGEAKRGAAEIVAGKYAIPAQQGLQPGKYRIEIRWDKPTGKQIASGDPGMMMEERVPVVPTKYNAESTLVEEIKTGENKLDFKLTK